MVATDDSDSSLVRAARAGDRPAFARLLARHWSLLGALCRRALDDPTAAEDAMQEAALTAMLNLDRLRRAERFGPWLAGIGLNVCRRWQRYRTHDAWSWEALVGGRHLAEPADQAPGPDEVAEVDDLRARVRRAVAGLPPGQRAAVLLYYLEGLPHAETARLLGIEVGAVKTRLHKARRTLRQRLWSIWKEDAVATDVATQWVEVRVADVRRRRAATGAAKWLSMMLLEEIGGERRLPIWMGQYEAEAIAIQIKPTQLQPPRPLTSAFMASLLQATGARLREVRVTKLVGDVFYGTAVVEGPTGEHMVDARPSDAVNLALAVGAPIRVEHSVFETAGARAHFETAPEGDWRTAYSQDEAEGAAEIAAAVQATWAARPSGPPAPG